jgi:hypothetical protein
MAIETRLAASSARDCPVKQIPPIFLVTLAVTACIEPRQQQGRLGSGHMASDARTK